MTSFAGAAAAGGAAAGGAVVVAVDGGGEGVDYRVMVHRMESGDWLLRFRWQLSISFVAFAYVIDFAVIQLFRSMPMMLVSIDHVALRIYRHHQLPIVGISIHVHAMLLLD